MFFFSKVFFCKLFLLCSNKIKRKKKTKDGTAAPVHVVGPARFKPDHGAVVRVHLSSLPVPLEGAVADPAAALDAEGRRGRAGARGGEDGGEEQEQGREEGLRER